MSELTATQERVVSLVAEGLKNKEIAYRLGICEGTVKTHVAAAGKKLGFHNRVKIAVWWVKRDTTIETQEAWHSIGKAERMERLASNGLLT